MKIGFWVEQCTHVLFQCPEYVNQIIKNHTKAVSGDFLRDLFVLVKIDFRGYVTF